MVRFVLTAILLVAGAVFAAPYLQEKIDAQPQVSAAPSTPPVDAKSNDTAEQLYGRMRVKADRSGHFIMTAVIKGRRIEVVADTGASTLSLNHEDARKLGIRPKKSDFTVPVRTANGLKYSAPVMLREVRIGSIRVRNVRALVSPPGAMSVNLLGMSFLGELSSFTMRGGELVMVQ